MPAYVIGEAHVFNPEAMKPYGPMIVASVKKYGGRYLARGARPEVLEGGPAHNILIIEFESADAARQIAAAVLLHRRNDHRPVGLHRLRVEHMGFADDIGRHGNPISSRS